MSNPTLEKIEAIIQRDVNRRGLQTDPHEDLLTACRGDFARACWSLASVDQPMVLIVTGFWIPRAKAPETDGPLGAIFLARVLAELGARVMVIADSSCFCHLFEAQRAYGLRGKVNVAFFPHRTMYAFLKAVKPEVQYWEAMNPETFHFWVLEHRPPFTHLIAIERAGPSHTPGSIQEQSRGNDALVKRFRREVPSRHWGQYHTMSGGLISKRRMYPVHCLFEGVTRQVPRLTTTIGIGDGGNEIGMGKIPWEVIARNVPKGGLVACRVPTDYNIVCGVSNWGAYGLAAGVWVLRRQPFNPALFDADREQEVWKIVLQRAQFPLVDGVTGQPTLTVDGLSWEEYIQPLREIAALLEAV